MRLEISDVVQDVTLTFFPLSSFLALLLLPCLLRLLHYITSPLKSAKAPFLQPARANSTRRQLAASLHSIPAGLKV